MTWHLDPAVLESYRRNGLSPAAADSLEAHLVSCGSCRLTMNAWIEPVRRERIWGDVSTVLLAPTERRVERALRRVGVRAASSRLLAMTPSVRPAWLLSVVAVLWIALISSRSYEGGSWLVWVVAPLVPVAGVAASFGPGVDPVFEVGLASPRGGFPLMLMRAVAVLSVSVVIVVVPAVVVVEFRSVLLCLLPALALTLLALVLASFLRPTVAAATATVLWTAFVLMLASGPSLDSMMTAAAQVSFALMAGVLGWVLFVRREAFEGS